jgi:hypothetical protein
MGPRCRCRKSAIDDTQALGHARQAFGRLTKQGFTRQGPPGCVSHLEMAVPHHELQPMCIAATFLMTEDGFSPGEIQLLTI